jgi:hydrogenase-4 component B
MDAIQLLLLSVALFGAAAFVSLLLNGFSQAVRVISNLLGMTASIIGLAAALRSAIGGSPSLVLSAPLPFGHFALQMDGLSTLMVGMIGLLAFAVCFYSISYLGQYSNRNLGVLGFCTNLFIALMLLVVTIDNAFYFLIFWEMMTLASYFLVTFESEKKEAIRSGYLYMLIAHAGGALIMMSFFVFFLTTGSFDFVAFRQAELTPALRSLVFLLAFIGFGAKAGMVPLHVWTPSAYSAAPSHASALMSSVMKKTAIYGILRVCVDFLGTPFLWWGVLVISLGALSTVLGVFYALTEQDLKRILAYSSIENVGIILMGIGTGMIGLATHQSTVTLLGFLAALYHALNHSFFKGLLFLGAGAVDYRLHSRNLNEMGGLGRSMPWTGLGFLIGALAVSAIPPLNGFVSEWFTYQAFFAASSEQDFIVRASMPLCAALLALAGTLALMVAIKMYGGAFVGPVRSEKARQAREVPASMLSGMAFLAIGCVFLGLGAPFVTPYLARVVTSTLGGSLQPVASGIWVYPSDSVQAVLSTPLIAILLLGLLIVPVILVALYRGHQSGERVVKDPWACGYGYTSQMAMTANNFNQPITVTFTSIYKLRAAIVERLKVIGSWSKQILATISRAEPFVENIIKGPTTRTVDYISQRVQVLQMGDIRMYCLYIVITLVILLIVIFR